MNPLPLPSSKNQLHAAVDKLTYTQRFNYGSRLGRDHKGKPALRTLVDELLKHPEAPVPEMEAEDGFTEILPAQRTTIAKHYDEDQIALAIAVSAGMFDVIKAHLTSPSTFLDNLVFSSYVRMKEDSMAVDSGKKATPAYRASDDEVIQTMLDAVPARRRLLIQETMQCKRFSIIQKLVPKLIALPNYPYKNVAHIIHACTHETVKQFLDKVKFTEVGQVWNKLVKFHTKPILELWQADLEKTDPFSRGAIWDAWTAWVFSAKKTKPYFFKNKEAMSTLLDIQAKYPVLQFLTNAVELKPVVKPGHVATSFPTIICEHFKELGLAFPQKLTKLMLETIYLRWDGQTIIGTQTLQAFPNLHLEYKLVNKIFQRALVPPPSTFGRYSGASYDIINRIISQPYYELGHWNTEQVLAVARMFSSFLLANKPPLATISDWSHLWSLAMTNAITIIGKRLDGIANASDKDKKKKADKFKKKQQKYRKAIQTLIGLYFEPKMTDVLDKLKGASNFKYRRANTYLDAIKYDFLSNVNDVDIARFALETAKPHLNFLVSRVQATKMTERQETADRFLSFLNSLLSPLQLRRSCGLDAADSADAKKLTEEIFRYIKETVYEELHVADISTLFSYDKDLTFQIFFPLVAEKAQENTQFVTEVFSRLSPEQRLAVFKWYDLKALVHMVQNKPSHLLTMLRQLPTEIVTEAVVHMLSTPNLIDENTKNELISFQDITDPKIRNTLQKMSNSNSTTERQGALTSLIISTARSKDKAQINRTLKFIREKIKNEAQSNRAETLNTLFAQGDANEERDGILIYKGFGESQIAIWYDMLADALESPDLDEGVYDKSRFSNHPVLSHFQTLAQSAIDLCTKKAAANFDPIVFDFGVEVLWRLNVFRHGEKKAATEPDYFVIPFSTVLFEHGASRNSDSDENQPDFTQQIRKLIAEYTASYEKRVVEKNPEWKKDFQYFKHFFTSFVVDYNDKVPEFMEIARIQMDRVKAEASKDDDGLYIISHDDAFKEILTTMKRVPREQWNRPHIAEIIDMGMHSRFAPLLIEDWVTWRELGAKTAREFRERRSRYIPELLSISPSAIHLRFVWRFLLTYMQNVLDDYIGKRKTFRGVFYVGPDQRKFDRSCLKTPETRRAGGRERSRPAGKRKATKAGVINKLEKETVEPSVQVEEERAKEKAIREELEDVPEELWDHEDFFYLEACHGLRRLLPRQVNVLAKDWEVQVLNADRAIPYRVKATARWTIMPTISYNDIVVFLNTNEAPRENHKGLSVNVIECLLRGVMRNDEPTAPLNFLLSPKFLGSDRSRVSVYAISQCVRYMPADGLTNMLKLCLTGKRRQQLKISSYKEIIRLLASTPTDEHLNMIFKEWKRPDLHRDIRIAIIHSAMQFLESNDKRFNDIAWKILDNAATLEDQHEILTALLGANKANSSALYYPSGASAYVKNKRIAEHLDDLSKLSIAERHAERYGTHVVAVMARTANNDDVKFLAVATLYKWPATEVAIELTQKYLKDFSAESLLYSIIPAEREIYTLRWNMLIAHLIELCLKRSMAIERLIDVAGALCDAILAASNKARIQRAALLELAKKYLQAIPIAEHLPLKCPAGSEDKLVKVFTDKLGGILMNFVFVRRTQQLVARASINDNILKPALEFIHDITAYASLYPSFDSDYLGKVETVLSASKAPYLLIMLDILELKVDASKSAISTTPEYLYLLRRAGLQSLTKHGIFSVSYPEATLKFWQNIFDFAAERKDIPREHFQASQIFSFSTLSQNITSVISCGRSVDRNHTVTYLEGTKTIIKNLAQRYEQVLAGKSGDAFAERVGRHLVEKNVAFFVDVVPSYTNILHLIIESDSEFAHKVIPQVVSVFTGQYKYHAANEFITSILNFNLAKVNASEKYIATCRSIGLGIITKSDSYATEKVNDVLKFFDQVIPILPSLSKSDAHPYYPELSERIETIVGIARNVSNYNLHSEKKNEVPPAAGSFLLKYVNQYMKQARIGTPEYGITQRVTREISHFFIKSKPDWVLQYFRDQVRELIDILIDESTVKDVSKSASLDLISSLAKAFGSTSSRGKAQQDFAGLFNGVIHLRLSAQPKSKKYIENSYDVALALFTTFPWMILEVKEDALYFINWAISLYIREPDVIRVYNDIPLHAGNLFLSNVKQVKEEHIKAFVDLLNTIIDLKHQKFVVAQQTLLPLQSYPQYTHVSWSLALHSVRDYGKTFHRTDDPHKLIWRDDFIALLDKLCNVEDPEIRQQAWAIVTESPK